MTGRMASLTFGAFGIMLRMFFTVVFTALVFAGCLATFSEQDPLPIAPKEGDEVAVMETSVGTIVLMFYPQKAPLHVANFIGLAKKGYFDGMRFHRTIKDFMIQGGDPNSKDLAMSSMWGTGGNKDENGKAINVKAEFTDLKHTRGVLSMARSSDPNSASSQFFIMHKDYPSLDGKYSAYGLVVKGIEVVDLIANKPTGDNGSVKPDSAVMINSVKIQTWPLVKE